MKASLILIVFNRSDLMKKSLLSLNYQSHLPDEVIVTDDGSTEDILGELKNISSKLNFKLKYLRQEHKNFRAAKARNNGAREAINDLLIFMDQDIISTKNYIKTFIDNADRAKFIVSYPIRLNKEQTQIIDKKMIENFNHNSILGIKQTYKIKKQFVKDYVSYLQKKFKINKKGPKLRSSGFAIHKENFIKVNGFDEKYQGWGNEDDDLGNRLYAANISGSNPFWNDYPMHLYHEPYHDGGERVNKNYYNNQKNIISNKNYKCEYGFDNPLGDEEIKVIEIN